MEMIVECICINNENRPEVIPINKWLKKGNAYTIIFTVLVLPQRQIGVHLSEIEFTEKELPYEYFLLSRFAFTKENFLLLNELIKECTDTDFSMEELLKQTELQEV